MKNISHTLTSFFNKMSDKLPIVQHGDFDESNDPNGHSSTRIVHFPRLAEDHSPPIIDQHNLHASDSPLAGEDYMRQTVSCPSCSGSGRIPRDHERQLVALIPFSDKRLKPRRTTLYVLIAVLISVVICGLCMFFLIPRSITLTSSEFEIIPYYASINETETIIKLSFINALNITNNNYVPITIVNATMSSIHVLDSKRMVGQATNLTQWTVPLRHSGVVGFNTSIVFDTSLMIDYCKLVKVIYMQFDIMVTSRYLGHEEQSGLTTNQRLYCSTKRE